MMPTHFFQSRALKFAFCVLAGFIATSAALMGADSSAEVVNKIQSRYDQDKAGLVEALRNLPDTPASLDDGSFSSTLTTLTAELDELTKELQAANQIIDRQRATLDANHVLSASDKSELSAELNRQQQPLTDLAAQITSFKSKVNDLIVSRIPAWKEQYHSFSDVEGTAAAKEKLSASIKSCNIEDNAVSTSPKKTRKKG
jgi:chromosome segregation ATPase